MQATNDCEASLPSAAGGAHALAIRRKGQRAYTVGTAACVLNVALQWAGELQQSNLSAVADLATITCALPLAT